MSSLLFCVGLLGKHQACLGNLLFMTNVNQQYQGKLSYRGDFLLLNKQ